MRIAGQSYKQWGFVPLVPKSLRILELFFPSSAPPNPVEFNELRVNTPLHRLPPEQRELILNCRQVFHLCSNTLATRTSKGFL